MISIVVFQRFDGEHVGWWGFVESAQLFDKRGSVFSASSNSGKEAISDARHRLNKARIFGVIFQRTTNLSDALDQRVVGDIRVLPNRIGEFVLGDEDARMLKEVQQNLKTLIAKSVVYLVAN